MKITLKELRTMIQESVVKALKEQEGPPNPLLDPWAGNQGVPQARRQVPGQTTAPTPAPSPAPTDQRQAVGQRSNQSATANVVRTINSIIRQLISLTPRGRNVLAPDAIITGVGTMDSMLSRLARNQDIVMLGKQDKVNQAVNLLKRVARTPIDSGANMRRLIDSIYTAARLLREVSRELGSQDSQTDQMIAQLAAAASTAPTSPEVGGMRQGMAPQALAGSQVVPVGYRPEGTPPQERPVMASAMQERRTKKR